MDPEQSVMLQLLDRLITPISSRMEHMDAKLDRVIQVSERVDQHQARLASVENVQSNHSLELAEIRGRNKVISWILGLLGAPIVVALAGAGVAHLVGWK